MQSYKKLAKLKKDTEYRLRYIKERLTSDVKNIDNNDLKAGIKYALISMEDLFKLYEIE